MWASASAPLVSVGDELQSGINIILTASSLTDNWSGYLQIFWTGVSRNPSNDISCKLRSNRQLYTNGNAVYKVVKWHSPHY